MGLTLQLAARGTREGSDQEGSEAHNGSEAAKGHENYFQNRNRRKSNLTPRSSSCLSLLITCYPTLYSRFAALRSHTLEKGATHPKKRHILSISPSAPSTPSPQPFEEQTSKPSELTKPSELNKHLSNSQLPRTPYHLLSLIFPVTFLY